MCAGALRAYLIEQSKLPSTPLIAMVPVNLRTEKDADGGGNVVGTILCNLATNLDDPAQRLEVISTSMCDNKKVLSQLPRLQALALSALLIAPLGLAAVPGFVSSAPPPFNIVISNVPGVREPMYYNGARLDGNYPLGSRWTGRQSTSPWRTTPTISISGSSDAGEACRTCSACSATWKMHSKIWNALSAFRFRSRTTTAAPRQHVWWLGSLRASPGAHRHYDTPRRRPTRPLPVNGRGCVPAFSGAR
jgi:hypothetical protein